MRPESGKEWKIDTSFLQFYNFRVYRDIYYKQFS